MKHTWTPEKARAFVEANKRNPNRGLKYCSAVDYLKNHASGTEKTFASPKKVADK